MNEATSVYQYYGASGQILYVGITGRGVTRFARARAIEALVGPDHRLPHRALRHS